MDNALKGFQAHQGKLQDRLHTRVSSERAACATKSRDACTFVAMSASLNCGRDNNNII